MNFGPAEMAQTMDSAKAWITVTIVSSVSIGIVLGAIVSLYRSFFQHRAADRSFQSGMPTVSAQEIDAAGPLTPRSPAPSADNLLSARAPQPRLVTLLVIAVLIATAGGGFLLYYTSKRLDFEATYNPQPGTQPLPPTIEPQQQARSDFEETYKQLGIQPLPLTVERQQQIQSGLAQLSREACYTDAIFGLGRALLDAGYPREAAISSRSFVKRCGSAPEVSGLHCAANT